MLKKNRFLACVMSYTRTSEQNFAQEKTWSKETDILKALQGREMPLKAGNHTHVFALETAPWPWGAYSEGAFIVMTRVWVLVSRHTPRGLTTMLCGCSQIHYWKPHTHNVNVILVKYIIWSDHCSKYQVTHPEFEHLVFTLLFTT